MLEHHIDGAPVGRNAGHVLASNENVAFAGLLETSHHTQAGRLAAAGWPQNGEELAGSYREIVFDNRRNITEPLGDVPELDNRIVQTHPPRGRKLN